MDNLGSHKANAVRRAIRARLFYLPKYSPDLNPIEQFFAKFKHWLRKAAQRTTEAVYDAIAPILDTVSPSECANYFANAGYDQTQTHPALGKLIPLRTGRKQNPSSGEALELICPRSSNFSPAPATRSETTRDTRISSGPEFAITRAAAWTAMPPISRP
jgi:DDE superfamily endonuclease